ncbi:MAG: ATP-binding protein, partial [Paracoccaceae bacterium]
SADLHALSAEARQIAMIGVQIFGNNTDSRRAGLEKTLIDVGLVTTLLVATLVCMLVVLLRLHHSNRSRAAQNIETLSRLNAVVATALDAVITVDGTGHIVDFNAAASATFGYSGGEAVGTLMSTLELTGAQEKPLFRAGSAPLISGQGRVRISARHKDGQVFPAEITIAESVAGEQPLYVAFLRDLSAQVAAEQALVKARDNALAGEKAKADLLVVMSHEIRTPLNGMIGTIELLGTTDLQAHQREYLRIMDASGKLLMHHVNDVLDIARLDSGKTPLRLGPVDLAALVGEVFDNQAPAARASGNRLTLTAAKDGRNRVIGDAVQLRQVLVNLVCNANKFTQDGNICVEIAHLGPTGPTEITVTDSGIGIATVDLDRIFDDFVTLDASYARPASGTGLGLGIVRRIVAHMGGTIRVDSQRGQGSTFYVTLPLPILDAGSVADPATETVLLRDRPTASAANLVTLVVEDNEFNRLIVRDMLVRDGHTVAEAHDGAEGIRLAAAQRFDLILMDISMPHTDGLQAARAIRAGHGASYDTPIIALTAHALQSESDRFYAGGMQAVLVKPITRETLRTTINAVFNPPPSAAATPTRP